MPFKKRFVLLLVAILACFCGSVALAAKARVHSVSLGAARRVPYSKRTDPSGAAPGETELKVRPLIVDDKVKDWTSGEIHTITDRSFAVRRAIRLNDALPGDRGEHWIWQRGPWLLVDRTNGHYVALKLPEYDPAVSQVTWYRDYAAYCGLSASGRQLYAVVAQLGARKPVLSRKLSSWTPHIAVAADETVPNGGGPVQSSTGACAAAAWQRDPLRVTFQHTGEATISYDLVGSSAVMVEEGDGEETGTDATAKGSSAGAIGPG